MSSKFSFRSKSIGNGKCIRVRTVFRTPAGVRYREIDRKTTTNNNRPLRRCVCRFGRHTKAAGGRRRRRRRRRDVPQLRHAVRQGQEEKAHRLLRPRTLLRMHVPERRMSVVRRRDGVRWRRDERRVKRRDVYDRWDGSRSLCLQSISPLLTDYKTKRTVVPKFTYKSSNCRLRANDLKSTGCKCLTFNIIAFRIVYALIRPINLDSFLREFLFTWV